MKWQLLQVVGLFPSRHRISVLSIPRDTRVYVEGAGIEKINAAHVVGGAPLACATVEKLLGIPIDHYVLIRLEGAEQLVDLIGGVDVYVERPLHYNDYSGRLFVHLNQGWQHLDGKKAVQYARYRGNQGDFHRIARQQRFLESVLKKIKEPKMLMKVPELIREGSKHIETNMDFSTLFQVAGFVLKISQEDIRIATIPGYSPLVSSYFPVYYHVPDRVALNKLLEDLFYNDDNPDLTSGDISYRVRLISTKHDASFVKEVERRLEKNHFQVVSTDWGSVYQYPSSRITQFTPSVSPKAFQKIYLLLEEEVPILIEEQEVPYDLELVVGADPMSDGARQSILITL